MSISNFQTFKRLFAYANQYKFKLYIGLLSGFLAAASIFGMLSSLSGAFDPQKQVSVENVDIQNKETTLGKQASSTESAPTIADAADKGADSMDAVLNYFGYKKTKADGSISLAALILSVLLLPIFLGLKGAFTYLNRYCMRWVGSRTIADFRNDLFKSLTNQSLKFYGKSNIGELMTRINTDTGIAEQLISTSIADLTRGPIEIIACLSFIVYHAMQKGLYSISLAMVLAAPLCIFPIIFLGRRIKKLTRKALSKISILTSHMLETFSGIRVVKAYHMEEEEHKRFVDANNLYFTKVQKSMKYELMISPLMEFVGVLIICLFLIYAYMQGLVLADLLPFGVAASLAYQPMKRLGKVITNMNRSLTGAGRAFDMLDLEPELVEAESPTVISELTDKFEFKNVTFSYDTDAPVIIDDLSLEIKKGDVVAFVGETGSGKSTISNLFARFYDPTSGEIFVDGVDLKQVEIKSLRALIGVVNQDTILFNESIFYNISYGKKNATEEEVMHAAKLANAHDFIMAEEDGYGRNVGEKGFRLSGGQKQRISIARAILNNPPVLILDEATSALDTVTEALVQDALNNLMENRTVLTIAHRLSTIKHANKICVLEKGRIVEMGTHDELYAKGGQYRLLCDIQFTTND